MVCIYKTTPISTATCCTFPNMVPYQSLYTYSFILSFGKQMILFKKCMHVNETIRNESKTCRKIKGGTYLLS